MRIEKQKAKKEKAMENLKRMFAIEIGLQFSSFYGVDDAGEEMRSRLESEARRKRKREEESSVGKIKKFLTSDTRREKSIEKEVKNTLRFLNAEKTRKNAMEKITEIKDEFKRRGLSGEDIKEIYNRVKEQEETDYIKKKEAEIKKA